MSEQDRPGYSVHTRRFTSRTVSFSATWKVRSGSPSEKRTTRVFVGGSDVDGPGSQCSEGIISLCLPFAISLSTLGDIVMSAKVVYWQAGTGRWLRGWSYDGLDCAGNSARTP